jgi:hypothetical protein
MYRGDISNQSEPRVLFVFDDLLAKVSDTKLYALEIRTRRYRSASNRWEFDPVVVARLNDIWWRKGYRFDIVSFQPDSMEDALQTQLDRRQVPYSSFWTSTPDQLSRQIAMMPDVVMVYDANPTHMFTYGGRGRTIIDPREI